MALSPVITLPPLHYGLVAFALKVVFYTHMRNAAYISFHHVEFHFLFRHLVSFLVIISCGVAVKVRSHREKFQVFFYGEGRGTENFFGGEGQFLRSS